MPAPHIVRRLDSLKGNTTAVAEAIENKVRRRIIKEHLADPAYYEKMSALLDEVIAARKAKAIEYECLEYIVVHEMVHLIERTHNARFLALMDRVMPQWRFRRQQLNRLPVRHEEWAY